MVCKRFLTLVMAGVLALSAPASITAKAAQTETEFINGEGIEADLLADEDIDDEEADNSNEASSEDSSDAVSSEDASNEASSEDSSDAVSSEDASNVDSSEDSSVADSSEKSLDADLAEDDLELNTGDNSEKLSEDELSESKLLSDDSQDFMEEYSKLKSITMSSSDTDFSRYSEDEQAIVSSFTMSWKGQSTIDLLANNAAYYAGTMRVPVDLTDYDGKKPFHFEIGVDNSSCVKSVDVIATIGGTDYTLVATRKNSNSPFVAEGYFDEGNDCEYLTSIRLKLNSSKPLTIFDPNSLGYDYDPAMVERYAFFNENIPGLVTAKEVDGLTEYTIDYGKLFKKTQQKAVKGVIKFTAGKLPKTLEEATGYGLDVLENSGYFVHGLDEDKYLFYEDKTKEDFQVLEYFADAGETYGDVMKMRLAFMEESGYSYETAGYNFADDSLEEFSKLWDQSVKAVGLANKVNKSAREREKTYEEIDRSTTIADKEKARKQADELYRDQCAYNIIKEAVIPMILAYGGIELAAAGPAGLVFGGLLLAVDIASDYMWEARATQIKGGSIGASKGGKFDYGHPTSSGYVNMSSSVLRTIKWSPDNPDSSYMWEEDWDFELYGNTNSGLTLTLEGNSVVDAEPFLLNRIPNLSDYFVYVTTIIFTNNTYNNSIVMGDYYIKRDSYNVTKVVFSPFAKTIGGFQGFTGLKDIVIPGTVEEIKPDAFSKSGIQTVTFQGTSSLKKIGARAFSGCHNLRGTIDIPGDKIDIGNSAFEQCENISKIIIRGELECIDNCFPSISSKLKEIWFYGPIDNISKNTTYISAELDKVYILGGIKNSELTFKEGSGGSSTTDYPFRANEIFFSGSRQEWEKLFPNHFYSAYWTDKKIHFGYKEDGTETAVKTGKCGAGLTYTLVDPGVWHDSKKGDWYDLYISGTGAMYDYANKEAVPWYGYRIRKVAIANGITRIGNYAFYGLKPYQKSIDIPVTVREIGDYAFAHVDCEGTYLVIPDNVEKIGKYSFYFYDANTLYISRSLTELPDFCFTGINPSGCVVIPENVKVIGDSVFSGISLYADTPRVFDIRGAEKIGSYAFSSSQHYDDYAKPTFKNTDFLKNVKEIGNNAFSYSTISGNLEFSQELTCIGSNAFEHCTGITGIKFGNKLTRIESEAFEDCSNITGNLVLPSSLEYIGYEAFMGCSGFTGDLTIPDSVTDIAGLAFKDCTGFDGRLVLPNPVNGRYNIGIAVFDNCTGFTGELVIDLEKMSVGNYHEYKFHRSFYGLTNLERITLKCERVVNTSSKYVTSANTLNGFVKSGEKGTSAEWGDFDDEFAEGDEQIILSTFSPDTKLDCDNEDVYKKMKELGYKANLIGKARGYTIRFDTGGYISIPDRTNQTVIPGNLPGLGGDGYIFGGWYLSPGCEPGQEVVIGATLTGDITLYAKLQAKEFSVTLNPGNGTLPEGTVNPIKLVYGKTYGELPTPIPGDDGESFIGWYTDQTAGVKVKADTNVIIANDHTLYARYKSIPALSEPYVTDAAGNRYENGAELKEGTRLYLRTAEGGTRIYFTTNKEEASILQDADDHLYRTALLLDKDVTVYAKAYKEGYKTSNTVSYNFKVKDPAADWGDVIEADRAGISNATVIPEGLWATGIEDRAYTGSAITFEGIRVYYGKKLLKEGTDYTIKYSGNVKASTTKAKGTVTVTCKGNYTGKKAFTFGIMPLDLSDNNNLKIADVQAIYTGKKIQSTTTVTYMVNGKETLLKKGTDFAYDYSEVGTEPGEYTVKIVGKGNYTGTATFKEIIYPKKEKINIAKLTFGKIGAQTADGKAKEPAIVITDKITDKKNPHTLTEEEFEVKYFNNVLAGTATAVVTGKGSYGGTKTLTYKINGLALSKAKFAIGAVTYNGNAQTPSYTLTYQANKKAEAVPLFEGEDKDYTVVVSNNIKKGNGTITFTGVGKYTGTVKKTFKITPLGFKEGGVSFVCSGKSSKDTSGDLGSFAYTKGGVKPEFKLMYGDKELVAGTDYKVKCANNNAVGATGKKAPSLTVTGAGNFTGTFTRTFAITAGSFESVRVTATDILYSGKGGNIKPTITVYDANGNKLAAGKDYDKNFIYTYASEGDIFYMEGKKYYQRHVEVGDAVDVKKHLVMPGMVIRVAVKGKGLYASDSENYADFTCVNNLLSKATIKLNKTAFDYTGDSIEISESDITVKIGGKTIPAGAYRIESITGNIQKGKATVTVAGNGQCGDTYYGGTKTVTFKINAKNINPKKTKQ